MCRSVVVESDIYKTLRNLRSGESITGRIATGAGVRVPGTFDVTRGGRAKPISCHISHPNEHGSNASGKRAEFVLTKR